MLVGVLGFRGSRFTIHCHSPSNQDLNGILLILPPLHELSILYYHYCQGYLLRCLNVANCSTVIPKFRLLGRITLV